MTSPMRVEILYKWDTSRVWRRATKVYKPLILSEYLIAGTLTAYKRLNAPHSAGGKNINRIRIT